MSTAMQPLRVTFEFSSPVSTLSDQPYHLDGLLAYCLSQYYLEDGHPDPWQAAKDLSVGLMKYGEDDQNWVWCASQLVLTPASGRYDLPQTRKCEPLSYKGAQEQGLLKGRRKFNVISASSGVNKQYYLLCNYQWLKHAQGWCLGNLEQLQMAFEYLTYIGKYAKNGFGRIRAVRVEIDDAAHERWQWRHMPYSFQGNGHIEYTLKQGQLRPSYWKKRDQIPLLAPVEADFLSS